MTSRHGAQRGWPAALAWSLVVAALLLAPRAVLPSPRVTWMDKPAHALLFAVEFALVARALAAARRGRPAASAAALSGLYAAALETGQIWVPGRGWEWLDLAAGLLGITLGWALLARRRARVRGPR